MGVAGRLLRRARQARLLPRRARAVSRCVALERELQLALKLARADVQRSSDGTGGAVTRRNATPAVSAPEALARLTSELETARNDLKCEEGAVGAQPRGGAAQEADRPRARANGPAHRAAQREHLPLGAPHCVASSRPSCTIEDQRDSATGTAHAPGPGGLRKRARTWRAGAWRDARELVCRGTTVTERHRTHFATYVLRHHHIGSYIIIIYYI